MTILYLIRHIQAEGNLYRIMQGQWDSRVTGLGLRQRDALAERLKEEKIDALYSSDLYRALVTASAVTKYHDLPVIKDARLREINIGPWEGRFFGDLQYEQPEAAETFLKDPESWHVRGAETYADVRRRAFEAVTEIAEANPEKAVAVVSHGVAVRCVLSAIMGIEIHAPDSVPFVSNTGITKLVYEDGRFTIEYVNDDRHMKTLGDSGWKTDFCLRAEPFNPESDRLYYEHCYADAWESAHGSLNGFDPKPYFRNAVRHYKKSNNAVLKIFFGDEAAGLLDLDSTRGAEEGYGWISLLYLNNKYRYRRAGVQLLGRAELYYRALGRKSLRLNVAEDNTFALAFYRKWGFKEVSSQDTWTGRLFQMEKKFEGQDDV